MVSVTFANLAVVGVQVAISLYSFFRRTLISLLGLALEEVMELLLILGTPFWCSFLSGLMQIEFFSLCITPADRFSFTPIYIFALSLNIIL